jgi:surfeit locus 1 family protein
MTNPPEAPAAVSRSIVRLSVAAAAAFSLLIALGTWQLQRMVWKRDLIAARTAQLALPPLVLAGASSGDASSGDPVPGFRRVRATGTFVHGKELYLGPRGRDGAPGYHVITPLRLAAVAVVLVDRGWVPLNRRDPATRLAGQVAGRVTVTGRVRPPPRRGPFTPENRPAKGEWFVLDVPAMAAHLGLRRALPYAIEAGPAANPGGWPKGVASAIRLADNHLQYAITWYALAAALAVIYVLLVRSNRKSETGNE